MYMNHEAAGDNISISPNPIKTSVSGTKISRTCEKRAWITAFVWDDFGVDSDNTACEQVGKFLAHMQALEIPHNWIMLYGGESLAPRIIVFPRKSAEGLQPHPSFDVSIAEMGGHLPYKTMEEFEAASFTRGLRSHKCAIYILFAIVFFIFRLSDDTNQ